MRAQEIYQAHDRDHELKNAPLETDALHGNGHDSNGGMGETIGAEDVAQGVAHR